MYIVLYCVGHSNTIKRFGNTTWNDELTIELGNEWIDDRLNSVIIRTRVIHFEVTVVLVRHFEVINEQPVLTGLSVSVYFPIKCFVVIK